MYSGDGTTRNLSKILTTSLVLEVRTNRVNLGVGGAKIMVRAAETRVVGIVDC